MGHENRRKMEEIVRRSAALLNACLSLETTLQTICDIVVDMMGYPFCSVRFLDYEKGTLIVQKAKGLSEDFIKEYMRERREIPLDGAISGRAARTGRLQFVEDIASLKLSGELFGRFVRPYRLKSYIAVPLKVGGEVLGVLSIITQRRYHLDRSKRRLLRLFAEQAGMALHRARLYETLRESEKAYRHLYELHRLILENIPAGVLWLDENLKVCWLNPEGRRIFGTPEPPPPSVIGQSVCELESVKRAGFAEKVKLLKQGKPFYLEGPYTSVFGKGSYISAVGVPVMEGERFRGGVVLFRDISERVKMEKVRRKLEAQKLVLKRLRELNRMKSQFLEMVAHELRTPLTPIRSLVEMFLEGSFGRLTKRQRVYMETLARNVERLARFTKDVLSLSRVEAGTYPLKIRDFALLEAVKPVVDLVSREAERVGMEVTCEVGARIVVHADLDAVSEVLTNLLVNAVMHCPAGTRISVTAKRVRKQVRVSVSDNGPGIPEDMLDRIFEPFVQARRESGPGYKGTGVGLAVCKGLVEKMGGRIWAENNKEGGARFSFTLPLAQEAG